MPTTSLDLGPAIADANHVTVINPADESVVAEIPSCTRGQFLGAVDHARDALKHWREDERARRHALHRCAEVLRNRANAFELAAMLTREQGKPKREAISEVFAASHWFASMSELTPANDSFHRNVGSAKIVYRPKGIVGAITAWNFPIFLAACKIAPALLAGNVMLLKPSPYTPMSTIRMVEMLEESAAGKQPALPTGVVQVLIGDNEVGKWLVESSAIAHVSFTGSTSVGKAIAVECAANLKSCTLELGGNDAAIVMADADARTMVPKIHQGVFTNAGQFCTGIKRLYVHDSLIGQVVDELADMADATIVGDGRHPKTQMGPLAHRAHFEQIKNLVEGVRERGATIKSGGYAPQRKGFFYAPTVVTDAAEEDPLVTSEQFGPVIPIISFSSIEDVIAKANDTEFGLGSSVWTEDPNTAQSVASRLESGTVWINQHGTLDPQIPFGGHKSSGVGVENAWEGVAEFSKIKAIHGRI